MDERRRRRPSTRPRLLRRLTEELCAFALEGQHVAVAVSGGVDSTALAWALAELAPRDRIALSIVHVNHSLRGTESDADEALVRELAAKLGVGFATKRVAPRMLREGADSSRSRPTVQEAARRLRDRALRGMARDLGAQRIATAHTADDQAETVLLRLLRGSGPAGLGGIAPRSADGVVVRRCCESPEPTYWHTLRRGASAGARILRTRIRAMRGAGCGTPGCPASARPSIRNCSGRSAISPKQSERSRTGSIGRSSGKPRGASRWPQTESRTRCCTSRPKAGSPKRRLTRWRDGFSAMRSTRPEQDGM